MEVVTAEATPSIEVRQVRPRRLALAVGAFGVVWGGSLFIAWRSWAHAAGWWARQVPGANAAIVDADRSRLLREAIGTSLIVLALVALAGWRFAGEGSRRHPG